MPTRCMFSRTPLVENKTLLLRCENVDQQRILVNPHNVHQHGILGYIGENHVLIVLLVLCMLVHVYACR